jgi:hypothetical protein
MRTLFGACSSGAALVVAVACLAGCGSGTDHRPEANCFDGIDDNGDGLVDCGDPTCLAGAECVAAADGYELGTRVELLEACPAAFPDTDLALGQGLVAGSTCDACQCSKPEAQCYAPMVTFESADCSGAYVHYASVSTAAICSGAGNPLGVVRSVYFGGVSLYAGSCTPNNPTTPTSWTQQARFCGTVHVGGGCATGQVCAPKAASHCALAPGAQACPAGYAQAHQASWYTAVADQRSCACTCDAPTGLSCAGTSVELLESMCDGPSTPAGLNACLAHEFGSTIAARAVGDPGGSCVPHGPGAMTGAALPTDERTLCCVP